MHFWKLQLHSPSAVLGWSLFHSDILVIASQVCFLPLYLPFFPPSRSDICRWGRRLVINRPYRRCSLSAEEGTSSSVLKSTNWNRGVSYDSGSDPRFTRKMHKSLWKTDKLQGLNLCMKICSDNWRLKRFTWFTLQLMRLMDGPPPELNLAGPDPRSHDCRNKSH